MATRFRVFTAEAGKRTQVVEEANQAMAEIEGQGGEYVESHQSVGGSSQSAVFTLVVVYREAEPKPVVKVTSY